MKPLCNSYTNTGAWKWIKKGDEHHLVHNIKLLIKMTLICVIIFLAITIVAYIKLMDKEIAILILIIGGGTCILFPVIMISQINEKKKAKSLFIYDEAMDISQFPSNNMKIENSRANLSFSHETHYHMGSHAVIEFNIKYNNKRYSFLSSSGLCPQIEKIMDKLKGMGFKVKPGGCI